MKQSAAMSGIRDRLQQEILSLQGFKRAGAGADMKLRLGPIEYAFPGRQFPTGAVHEFLSYAPEHAAATNGFIAALLGGLMQKNGTAVWVSNRRLVFPPALAVFGIEPDRIIFIDTRRPKDMLWAVEESLKCSSVTAVIGELKDLSFTESRRLQLAVEESRVTGLIHRCNPATENTVACVSRWKITPLASVPEDGMPGVGFPRWNVELSKVRNGKPGSWQLEWAAGRFRYISGQSMMLPRIHKRKVG